jgi:putative phage-type endonuclease
MSDAAQGTIQWFADRLGHATASRAKDILAVIKSGEAASRRNYKAQLVAERLTGTVAESYKNTEMQWGTDTEPLARMAYESKTGRMVMETGFTKHATIPFVGASLDGSIDADGGIEIKCPNTATHIDTLLKGMDAGHAPQIQFQMWVSGRQWIDFVSFDPRMPERLQLYVQRVSRDDAFIANLAAETIRFLGEVSTMVADLNKLMENK